MTLLAVKKRTASTTFFTTSISKNLSGDTSPLVIRQISFVKKSIIPFNS